LLEREIRVGEKRGEGNPDGFAKRGSSTRPERVLGRTEARAG